MRELHAPRGALRRPQPRRPGHLPLPRALSRAAPGRRGISRHALRGEPRGASGPAASRRSRTSWGSPSRRSCCSRSERRWTHRAAARHHRRHASRSASGSCSPTSTSRTTARVAVSETRMPGASRSHRAAGEPPGDAAVGARGARDGARFSRRGASRCASARALTADLEQPPQAVERLQRGLRRQLIRVERLRARAQIILGAAGARRRLAGEQRQLPLRRGSPRPLRASRAARSRCDSSASR